MNASTHSSVDPPRPPSHPPVRRSRVVPAVISGAVLLVLTAGAILFARANAQTNTVALSSQPKGVTVVEAVTTTYRPTRKYVGTLEPWISARVGPQLVSAYVDSVLVRPGASVKRGEVLATLDCRSASSASRTVAMQARALEARQKAIANESARVQGLLDGGFVSANEAEMKRAQTDAEQSQLLALRSQLSSKSLEVDDCVLRAPFDGEVSARAVDPGAFVRPGTPIVTVVDRSTVRLSAYVPEVDFDAVAPGTEVRIRLVSTGTKLVGAVARRSPAADTSTRTVQFEVDIVDSERAMPVGTTAEIDVDVGEAKAALRIPLLAAKVRGKKASLFVVDSDVAKVTTALVMGESGGDLFIEPSLKPGARVVTEGRSSLKEGDRVTFKLAARGGAAKAAPAATSVQ